MSRIAYIRASTGGKSISAQRKALLGPFDREFIDVNIEYALPAGVRPGFSQLLGYVKSGDTVCVYALDRLGKDALDIQKNCITLLEKVRAIEVFNLGTITHKTDDLIMKVIQQFAFIELERAKEILR